MSIDKTAIMPERATAQAIEFCRRRTEAIPIEIGGIEGELGEGLRELSAEYNSEPEASLVRQFYRSMNMLTNGITSVDAARIATEMDIARYMSSAMSKRGNFSSALADRIREIAENVFDAHSQARDFERNYREATS